MKKEVNIIIVAHGSKKREANEEIIDLCKNLKKQNSGLFFNIEYAFLEFAEPSIKMAFDKLVKKGVNSVYVYPYFLNSGNHVKVDIPNIVEEIKDIYKNLDIYILSHFGSSESIHISFLQI